MIKTKDQEVSIQAIGLVAASTDFDVSPAESVPEFVVVDVAAGANSKNLVVRGKPTYITIVCTATIAGGGAADGTLLYFDVNDATRVTMTEGAAADWTAAATAADTAIALAAAINASAVGGGTGVLKCTAVASGANVIVTPAPSCTHLNIESADGAGGGTAFVVTHIGGKKIRVLSWQVSCAGTTPTFQFKSAHGGTALTGAIPGGAFMRDKGGEFGCFECLGGQSLYVDLTSGAADGAIDGVLTYVRI